MRNHGTSALIALGVLLLPAAVLIGCGSSTTPISTTPRFLVSPNKVAAPNVNVYSVDASTGVLTPIPAGTPNPSDMGLTTPVSIITHPTNGSLLFVNDNATHTVTPLTIDSTGKLTKGTTSVALSGSQFFTSSLAMTPNGSCLFVAEGITGSPRVGVFSVASNGTLTLVADQLIANVTAGGSITSVAATAANLYMVAADAVPNQLITVPINPSTCALGAAGAPGALGATCTNYIMTAGDPANGNCCGLTTVQVDPAGKFVYIGSDFGGMIAGYTLDATGTHFTGRQQDAVPGGTGVNGGVGDIQFTRDGKFVYVSSNAKGLTAFNYNASTGKLGTEITTAPLDAASAAAGCLVIDRADHLIYTAPGFFATSGGNFHGYARNSNNDGTVGAEMTTAATTSCVALTY